MSNLEESQRQKKTGSVLQRDLVDVLQSAATQGGLKGILISVSKVKVTIDLSVAKVYLSIFPNNKGTEILKGIKSNAPLIKHEIAHDSLEYMDQIDQSLKGQDNPIKDPSILDKRKKS